MILPAHRVVENHRNEINIDKVRRIFGPDSARGTTDMSSPLVHIHYDGLEQAKITAYGYFLDFDDAPLTSNQTLGLRYRGNTGIGRQSADYLVEYARQTPYRDGADEVEAHYLHLDAGIKIRGVRLGVAYELLSGDGSYGFQTPLATAHAFNGWADLFLTTPTVGLRDTNVSVSGKALGFKIRAVYHNFQADEGGQDFGREFNFIATRKIADRVAIGVKYADYQADQFGTDTTKLWAWAGVSY